MFMSVVAAHPAYAAFQDEAEEEYDPVYEEHYAAWEAADQETDPLKSGAMIIEFMQKNPDSKMIAYFDGSFKRLLFKCSEEKKYQELETLAEQWNAFKPGEKETLLLIASAAKELKHEDKYLKALEEIYKIDPQPAIALEIARIYKDKQDDASYFKWLEPVLNAPEYEAEFNLRYELMNHYAAKEDTAKTIEYAQATLASMDKLKDPSAEVKAALPALRRAINHNIGAAYYNDKKYDQAIASVVNALKVEKYADGYYLIGRCLDEQRKVDNALVAYAKAQLTGEAGDAAAQAVAAKAKDRLEVIYKALHNNTTIGIDKQYRKARETADENLTSPM
ncbi:MAG: hypothetical protein LBT74_06570 [Acidobacteriota bacterium]|nr:hypothetical protein [Acidobacteriota bacterium]